MTNDALPDPSIFISGQVSKHFSDEDALQMIAFVLDYLSDVSAEILGVFLELLILVSGSYLVVSRSLSRARK